MIIRLLEEYPDCKSFPLDPEITRCQTYFSESQNNYSITSFLFRLIHLRKKHTGRQFDSILWWIFKAVVFGAVEFFFLTFNFPSLNWTKLDKILETPLNTTSQTAQTLSTKVSAATNIWCFCLRSSVVDHHHHHDGHRQQERRRRLVTCTDVQENVHRWPLLYVQLAAGLDLSPGSCYYMVLCFCHHVWSDGLQNHFR